MDATDSCEGKRVLFSDSPVSDCELTGRMPDATRPRVDRA